MDGGLVNMFCGDTASVSLQNSAAGLHSLMVVPADNNHSDMMYMKEAKTVKFTYRPTNPLATIKPANLGKPSISITSPTNGQTVSGTFPVTISAQNFR